MQKLFLIGRHSFSGTRPSYSRCRWGLKNNTLKKNRQFLVSRMDGQVVFHARCTQTSSYSKTPLPPQRISCLLPSAGVRWHHSVISFCCCMSPPLLIRSFRLLIKTKSTHRSTTATAPPVSGLWSVKSGSSVAPTHLQQWIFFLSSSSSSSFPHPLSSSR